LRPDLRGPDTHRGIIQDPMCSTPAFTNPMRPIAMVSGPRMAILILAVPILSAPMPADRVLILAIWSIEGLAV
jgi:hypothetical protein